MTLSQESLIEFAQPSSAEILAAGQTYIDLLPVEVRSITDNLENIQRLPSFIVTVDGTKAFHVWFSLTDDGGFTTEAVVKLADGFNPQFYYDGCDRYARNLGCRYMRFKTALRGAVKMGIRNGFKVEGLLLYKDL